MSSPSFLLAAAVALALAVPADAQRRGDATAEAQRSRIMPLPRVEARVQEHPAVKDATYLGPEYKEALGIYRFKFMRGAQVIYLDVDARSGRVLQITGK